MHESARRSGGVGHAIERRHAGLLMSGVRHRVLGQPFQLVGASSGQAFAHSGLWASNVRHSSTTAGTAGNFGGSATVMLPCTGGGSGSKLAFSLYVPASPRRGANTRMKYVPFA